jgi:hypothetical protein
VGGIFLVRVALGAPQLNCLVGSRNRKAVDNIARGRPRRKVLSDSLVVVEMLLLVVGLGRVGGMAGYRSVELVVGMEKGGRMLRCKVEEGFRGTAVDRMVRSPE